MNGNIHVQFLGEGVAVTSPPYPTRSAIGGSRQTRQDPQGRRPRRRAGGPMRVEK